MIGWGLAGLSVLQLGLEVYGITESAKLAKEQAALKKEDIALQKESIELNAEARKMQEELAEAKVRKDLRSAQAKMLARNAISGASNSSIARAMSEGMITEAESGIAVQKELAGIQTAQSGIQEQRLDVAASMIREPDDLDVILDIAGATIEAGTTAVLGFKYGKSSGRGGRSTADSQLDYTMSDDGFVQFGQPSTNTNIVYPDKF